MVATDSLFARSCWPAVAFVSASAGALCERQTLLISNSVAEKPPPCFCRAVGCEARKLVWEPTPPRMTKSVLAEHLAILLKSITIVRFKCVFRQNLWVIRHQIASRCQNHRLSAILCSATFFLELCCRFPAAVQAQGLQVADDATKIVQFRHINTRKQLGRSKTSEVASSWANQGRQQVPICLLRPLGTHAVPQAARIGVPNELRLLKY